MRKPKPIAFTSRISKISISVKDAEPPDRLATGILFGLHLLIIILAGFLPILLLTQGETPAGRWVGLAIFIGIAGTLSLWIPRGKRARTVQLGLVVVVAFSFWSAYRLAPSTPDATGNFREFYSGKATFQRRSLARLVPEVDQLKLGSYFFGVADPYINTAQAKELRQSVVAIYRELRRDPDFVHASSALGMAYQDLFLAHRPPSHHFEYHPKTVSGDYIMLFLHGSLGNFKGYLWALKEAADELGIPLIAPTFGAGNWQLDSDFSQVKAMLAYCQSQPELASKRIILAGVSNGGRGCLRAFRNMPESFDAMVLISPVIENSFIHPDAYSNKSVLILHGTKDRRIPVAMIQESAALMTACGGNVESRYWEDEDHFLLFSQRAEITRTLVNWLRGQASRKL